MPLKFLNILEKKLKLLCANYNALNSMFCESLNNESFWRNLKTDMNSDRILPEQVQSSVKFSLQLTL